MKKISFPFLIGSTNWIIVIVILFLFSINPNVTPKSLYSIEEFMGYYLKYSFIPALVSIVLTKKVNEGYKSINKGINLVFLSLYTLIFLFARAITKY